MKWFRHNISDKQLELGTKQATDRLAEISFSWNKMNEDRRREYEEKSKRQKNASETMSAALLKIEGRIPSLYLTGVTYPKMLGYACPRCKSNGKEVCIEHVPVNRMGVTLDTAECPECGLSMWFYANDYCMGTDMYFAEFEKAETETEA